jgi:hypothetical protein
MPMATPGPSKRATSYARGSPGWPAAGVQRSSRQPAPGTTKSVAFLGHLLIFQNFKGFLIYYFQFFNNFLILIDLIYHYIIFSNIFIFLMKNTF